MSIRRRAIAVRVERTPELLEKLLELKSRLASYLRWSAKRSA